MSGIESGVICLAVAAALALPPAACARADIVPTRAAASAQERQELESLMQRPDIARRLEVMGVNPRLARQRIAALDDEEVHALHERLKGLPQQTPDAKRLSAFAAALMLGSAFGGRR